jgi:hypothetical protein
MKADEFKKTCLDIIGPVYPNAEEWIDRSWQRVVDAVKLHSGRSLLKAFTNCVNFKGKLDFFFQDIARYLPPDNIGAGLVREEDAETYFNRMGLKGSMAKEELTPLTDKEKEEGEVLLNNLKKRFMFGGNPGADG